MIDDALRPEDTVWTMQGCLPERVKFFELKGNGDLFYRGKFLANDQELLQAFAEWNATNFARLGGLIDVG